MSGQVVDERVSRRKFEAELERWRRQSSEHTKRGIFVLEASFPKVFAVFAAAHLVPPGVVFAVEVDFTNYDLWPPSVRFLQPFTREPFRPGQLPPFVRITPPVVAGTLPNFQQAVMFQDMSNAQSEAFMCMPGVREYHEHPAHNGDSWMLHRGTGEGTLFHVLDKLHEFGIAPLAINLGFQIQYRVAIPGVM